MEKYHWPGNGDDDDDIDNDGNDDDSDDDGDDDDDDRYDDGDDGERLWKLQMEKTSDLVKAEQEQRFPIK